MPSEISGGMKKRVGIARAIVNDSKYLFCDEPNSGLDPLTAIKIDDLILELTKKLNRAIGMIYKIRYNCTKHVLLSLYFSLFHSHLSYGVSVWGTSNDGYISKLGLLQNVVHW